MHKDLPVKKQTHSKIIDALGGTGEVATLCEVSSQAVSGWRRKGIPKSRVKYLKLLKPNVFEGTTKEVA